MASYDTTAGSGPSRDGRGPSFSRLLTVYRHPANGADRDSRFSRQSRRRAPHGSSAHNGNSTTFYSASSSQSANTSVGDVAPAPPLRLSTRRLQVFSYVLAEISSAATLLPDYTRAVLNLARQLMGAWQAVSAAAVARTRYEHALIWMVQHSNRRADRHRAESMSQRRTVTATAARTGEMEKNDGRGGDGGDEWMERYRQGERRHIAPTSPTNETLSATTAPDANQSSYTNSTPSAAATAGVEQNSNPLKRRRMSPSTQNADDGDAACVPCLLSPPHEVVMGAEEGRNRTTEPKNEEGGRERIPSEPIHGTDGHRETADARGNTPPVTTDLPLPSTERGQSRRFTRRHQRALLLLATLQQLWMDAQETEDWAGQHVEHLRGVLINALLQQYLGVTVEQSYHDLVLHPWLDPLLASGRGTPAAEGRTQRARAGPPRGHTQSTDASPRRHNTSNHAQANSPALHGKPKREDTPIVTTAASAGRKNSPPTPPPADKESGAPTKEAAPPNKAGWSVWRRRRWQAAEQVSADAQLLRQLLRRAQITAGPSATPPSFPSTSHSPQEQQQQQREKGIEHDEESAAVHESNAAMVSDTDREANNVTTKRRRSPSASPGSSRTTTTTTITPSSLAHRLTPSPAPANQEGTPATQEPGAGRYVEKRQSLPEMSTKTATPDTNRTENAVPSSTHAALGTSTTEAPTNLNMETEDNTQSSTTILGAPSHATRSTKAFYSPSDADTFLGIPLPLQLFLHACTSFYPTHCAFSLISRCVLLTRHVRDEASDEEGEGEEEGERIGGGVEGRRTAHLGGITVTATEGQTHRIAQSGLFYVVIARRVVGACAHTSLCFGNHKFIFVRCHDTETLLRAVMTNTDSDDDASCEEEKSFQEDEEGLREHVGEEEAVESDGRHWHRARHGLHHVHHSDNNMARAHHDYRKAQVEPSAGFEVEEEEEEARNRSWWLLRHDREGQHEDEQQQHRQRDNTQPSVAHARPQPSVPASPQRLSPGNRPSIYISALTQADAQRLERNASFDGGAVPHLSAQRTGQEMGGTDQEDSTLSFTGAPHATVAGRSRRRVSSILHSSAHSTLSRASEGIKRRDKRATTTMNAAVVNPASTTRGTSIEDNGGRWWGRHMRHAATAAAPLFVSMEDTGDGGQGPLALTSSFSASSAAKEVQQTGGRRSMIHEDDDASTSPNFTSNLLTGPPVLAALRQPASPYNPSSVEHTLLSLQDGTLNATEVALEMSVGSPLHLTPLPYHLSSHGDARPLAGGGGGVGSPRLSRRGRQRGSLHLGPVSASPQDATGAAVAKLLDVSSSTRNLDFEQGDRSEGVRGPTHAELCLDEDVDWTIPAGEPVRLPLLRLGTPSPNDSSLQPEESGHVGTLRPAEDADQAPTKAPVDDRASIGDGDTSHEDEYEQFTSSSSETRSDSRDVSCGSLRENRSDDDAVLPYVIMHSSLCSCVMASGGAEFLSQEEAEKAAMHRRSPFSRNSGTSSGYDEDEGDGKEGSTAEQRHHGTFSYPPNDREDGRYTEAVHAAEELESLTMRTGRPPQTQWGTTAGYVPSSSFEQQVLMPPQSGQEQRWDHPSVGSPPLQAVIHSPTVSTEGSPCLTARTPASSSHPRPLAVSGTSAQLDTDNTVTPPPPPREGGSAYSPAPHTPELEPTAGDMAYAAELYARLEFWSLRGQDRRAFVDPSWLHREGETQALGEKDRPTYNESQRGDGDEGASSFSSSSSASVMAHTSSPSAPEEADHQQAGVFRRRLKLLDCTVGTIDIIAEATLMARHPPQQQRRRHKNGTAAAIDAAEAEGLRSDTGASLRRSRTKHDGHTTQGGDAAADHQSEASSEEEETSDSNSQESFPYNRDVQPVNDFGQELLFAALHEATELVVCGVRESRAHGGYHDLLHQHFPDPPPPQQAAPATTCGTASPYPNGPVESSENSTEATKEMGLIASEGWAVAVARAAVQSRYTFAIPIGTLSHDERDPFTFDRYEHLGACASVRWSQGDVATTTNAVTPAAAERWKGKKLGDLGEGDHAATHNISRGGISGVAAATAFSVLYTTGDGAAHNTPHTAPLPPIDEKAWRCELLKCEFRLARSRSLDVLLVDHQHGRPIAVLTLEPHIVEVPAFYADTQHTAVGDSKAGQGASNADPRWSLPSSPTATESAQDVVQRTVFAVKSFSHYMAPLWRHLAEEKAVLVDMDRTLMDNVVTVRGMVARQRQQRHLRRAVAAAEGTLGGSNPCWLWKAPTTLSRVNKEFDGSSNTNCQRGGTSRPRSTSRFASPPFVVGRNDAAQLSLNALGLRSIGALNLHEEEEEAVLGSENDADGPSVPRRAGYGDEMAPTASGERPHSVLTERSAADARNTSTEGGYPMKPHGPVGDREDGSLLEAFLQRTRNQRRTLQTCHYEECGAILYQESSHSQILLPQQHLRASTNNANGDHPRAAAEGCRSPSRPTSSHAATAVEARNRPPFYSDVVYVRPGVRQFLYRAAVQWHVPVILVTKSTRARAEAVLQCVLDPHRILFPDLHKTVVTADELVTGNDGAAAAVSLAPAKDTPSFPPQPTSKKDSESGGAGAPSDGRSVSGASTHGERVRRCKKSAVKVLAGAVDAAALETARHTWRAPLWCDLPGRLPKTRSVAVLDDAPQVWTMPDWPLTVNVAPYTLARVDPRVYWCVGGFMSALTVSCLFSSRCLVCVSGTLLSPLAREEGRAGGVTTSSANGNESAGNATTAAVHGEGDVTRRGIATRSAPQLPWPHCLCVCPPEHLTELAEEEAVVDDDEDDTKAWQTVASSCVHSPSPTSTTPATMDALLTALLTFERRTGQDEFPRLSVRRPLPLLPPLNPSAGHTTGMAYVRNPSSNTSAVQFPMDFHGEVGVGAVVPSSVTGVRPRRLGDASQTRATSVDSEASTASSRSRCRCSTPDSVASSSSSARSAEVDGTYGDTCGRLYPLPSSRRPCHHHHNGFSYHGAMERAIGVEGRMNTSSMPATPNSFVALHPAWTTDGIAEPSMTASLEEGSDEYPFHPMEGREGARFGGQVGTTAAATSSRVAPPPSSVSSLPGTTPYRSAHAYQHQQQQPYEDVIPLSTTSSAAETVVPLAEGPNSSGGGRCCITRSASSGTEDVEEVVPLSVTPPLPSLKSAPGSSSSARVGAERWTQYTDAKGEEREEPKITPSCSENGSCTEVSSGPPQVCPNSQQDEAGQAASGRADEVCVGELQRPQRHRIDDPNDEVEDVIPL